MKKNIIIVFTFFAYLHASGQAYFPPNYVNISNYKIIDSAYMKCTYKLDFIKDTSKPEKKYTDRQTLLIGKNISRYYSQYKSDHYKFVTEYLKTHDSYPNNEETGTWSLEYYKNYPNGKETVTDIGSILRANFIYEEELPKFQWNLYNEQQVILSYRCYKATVRFRGRDYIAWYTKEVPINNGPWKFNELPGLILKVYDTKQQFVFECIGLEKLKVKEPIKFYKVDYTKTDRINLEKLYKRFHNDFVGYMKTNFGTRMIEVDSQTGKENNVQHSTQKLPYNPIELE